METVLLVRYGEIHLKGLNRPFFEKKLLMHIKNAIKDFGDCKVLKTQGRFFIKGFVDENQIIERVTKIFGVHSVSPALELDKDISIIEKSAVRLLHENGIAEGTFKVESRRSDKTFPMDSMSISREIGGYILEHIPGLQVDVHQPDCRINIEIRERAYLYIKTISAVGGMPIGTNGKAMLLLSGGIDSPVAGWMIAKRGVELEAVHFYSFPYTSERAKEKVIELSRLLTRYCGNIPLHIVPFTEIQRTIYEKCPDSQITVLMRRFMMRIAEQIAKNRNGKALITGESIGQVASQTIESLHTTNSVVEMPVFRPLIGFDKIEIMNKAREIGTYETSILPYEDCCTVFVPKHPVTHPKLDKIQESEKELDIDSLIIDALANTEIIFTNEEK